MKKILVIALEKNAVIKYMENLEWFFSGIAMLEGICIKEDSPAGQAEADVFLISNQSIFTIAKNYMPENSQVEGTKSICCMPNSFRNAANDMAMYSL